MAETPAPRRQLHGYVSTEARDGWYSFAEAQGVNVTALMEALGSVFAEHAKTPSTKLPPLLKSAVSEARTIASGRSTRRRA